MRVGKANRRSGCSITATAPPSWPRPAVQGRRREVLGDWGPESGRRNGWEPDRLGSREHQVCLAHLIRDVQYVIIKARPRSRPARRPSSAPAPSGGGATASPTHPENLSRRSQSRSTASEPQARPRRGQDFRKPSRQSGATLRLHDQSGDRGDQQWLQARVTSRRCLSKNHQRLPKRMGRLLRRTAHRIEMRDDAASAPSTQDASPSKVAAPIPA